MKRFTEELADLCESKEDAGTEDLDEANGTPMRCDTCDNEFEKKIGRNTIDVECPNCGCYDTEIVEDQDIDDSDALDEGFTEKPFDFRKMKKYSKFLKMPMREAKVMAGTSKWGNESNMGDVMFKLGMIAAAWIRNGEKGFREDINDVDTDSDILDESDGNAVREVLNMLLGGDRKVRSSIRRKLADDKQSIDLSNKIYTELADRFGKVLDQDLMMAMNRYKEAARQSDSSSARNLIFKAAILLKIKPPSGSF